MERTRRRYVDESRIHHASSSVAESRRTQIARSTWLSFTWTSHLLLITNGGGTSDIWMHVNNLYTDAELYPRTQAVGSDRRRQMEEQYCVVGMCENFTISSICQQESGTQTQPDFEMVARTSDAADKRI